MRLEVKHLGPIAQADVTLGDLTVAVGPQATGKSILWQTLKLALDTRAIRRRFERVGIEWGQDRNSALALYYGEGMHALFGPKTQVTCDGKVLNLGSVLKRPRGRASSAPAVERMFYVPAQRVMAMRGGITRAFLDFQPGDPYVLRCFGDDLHRLAQKEYTSSPTLFPQRKRLKAELRDCLDQGLFRGFALELRTDAHSGQKRMVLSKDGVQLPVMAWSAGQREFTPLLLGLYWLMPAGGSKRRRSIEWVVIEEPEMGLHPRAILAFLVAVLDLLERGYRVILSTHSTVVLDAVWGLRTLQRHNGSVQDVLRAFELPSNPSTKSLALAGLKKSLKVYYFQPQKGGSTVLDISDLDLESANSAQAQWGGLIAFTAKIGDVVADVVQREWQTEGL